MLDNPSILMMSRWFWNYKNADIFIACRLPDMVRIILADNSVTAVYYHSKQCTNNLILKNNSSNSHII